MEGPIEVVFLDQTGAKRVRAKISPTVTAKQIIPNVITRMTLPATAPDGTPMSYSLDHKEGGKRLQEDQTLPQAGVKEGDHLIVYPEIVAGMDTISYRSLISQLDQDIERAKEEFERNERRERLQQQRKLLGHWEEGLKERKEKLARYNGKTQVDLDGKLAEIRKEIEELERSLLQDSGVFVPGTETAAPPPPVPAAVFAPGDKAAVAALIEEVNRGVSSLGEMPFEERMLQLRLWGAKFRLLAINAGQEVVGREAIFKAAYAAIANARDQHAPAERIEGLTQSASQQPGVWTGLIETLKYALQKAAHERDRDEKVARAADEALQELSVFVSACVLASEEEWRTFRHLIRKAASYAHLRPEVAELCRKYRPDLEAEFGFLWAEEGPREAEPEEPSKKWTAREIVQRICRRLKSKSMIGACHAPFDMVTQGFPGHVYGKAEEALDVLAKLGYVRKRRTGIGFRVSLEPGAMPAIDALIEGKPAASSSLETWMKEAE